MQRGEDQEGQITQTLGGKGRQTPAPLFVLCLLREGLRDRSAWPVSPHLPRHPLVTHLEVFLPQRDVGCGLHGEGQGILWVGFPPHSSSPFVSVPAASVPGGWGHLLHRTLCQLPESFRFDPGAGKPIVKAERTGRGGGHWEPKSDRTYFVPHLPREDLIPALQCRVPALGGWRALLESWDLKYPMAMLASGTVWENDLQRWREAIWLAPNLIYFSLS